MKKLLSTLCLGLGLGFAGTTALAADQHSVAFFVNGTLGDKSFFDSAERGMARLGTEMGMKTRTVEGTFDPTRWESGLVDLAESGEYDIIVTGTYSMVPLVEKVSQEYPDIKFVLFDGIVDYAKCGCKNVHSILFKQNEGSYLAGVLAGSLTKAGVDGTNPDGTIGFVGGMEIPVITDFLVGYTAGAKSVLPDVKVLGQYANNFADPALGKELGLAQYGQGADIVFAVAGGTGQGVLEAANEQGHLSIGVDSDQAAILKDSNPAVANRIVTSVLKNVDNALVNAMARYAKGDDIFGKADAQGLATGGVGLAINDVTKKYASAELLAKIDQISADIVSGKIKVPTAF